MHNKLEAINAIFSNKAVRHCLWPHGIYAVYDNGIIYFRGNREHKSWYGKECHMDLACGWEQRVWEIL